MKLRTIAHKLVHGSEGTAWEHVASWSTSNPPEEVPKWVLDEWSRAGSAPGSVCYIRGKMFIYRCSERMGRSQGNGVYTVSKRLRRHVYEEQEKQRKAKK